MSSPRGHLGRIPYHPALDGLRGIALFFMLVYHGDFSWIGGGYLAVSTFFTLSGFLITALLLVEREESGRIDLSNFWVRRLRRLMPAALLGLGLVAAFAAFVATPSQLSRLRWDAASALFYFSNFRFMSSGHSYWEIFSRPSPLQHYWSLSIEEQFYVVYPLLLLAVYAIFRRPRRALAVVVLVLAVASTATMVGLALADVAPARLYYGTDTRASEFLVGGLLATLLVGGRGEIRAWRGRGLRLATLLSVAYVVAVVVLVEQDSPFLYRGGFALYSVATAVIINAALEPGAVRSVLAWGWLPWAGAISYGAYIYHWPIYLWLGTERTGLSGVRLLLVQIAVTLAAAAVSYRFLERPIRVGSWPQGRKALLAPPAAALAVLGALMVLTADLPGAEVSFPTDWKPPPMPELGSPAPEGPLRVMVVGDSIAHNLAEGMMRWSKRRGSPLTVWNLAEYGCGLARGGERGGVPERSERLDCGSWADWWEVEVERFRPDFVVILSGIWDVVDRRMPGWSETFAPGAPAFDAWLLSEYQLAVDVVSSRGARVIWVTSPCVGPPPPRAPLVASGAFELARIEYLNRVLLPRLVASRPRQVMLFDLFARICPDGRYVASDDDFPDLRTDHLHIGKHAATWFAGEIAAEMLPRVGPEGPDTQPVAAPVNVGGHVER